MTMRLFLYPLKKRKKRLEYVRLQNMVVRFCNITHFLTDRQEKKRKKTINLVKIIKNYKKNGYFSKN